MAIGEEQDEHRSASSKGTVMPLRRWRCVLAETTQGLLQDASVAVVAGRWGGEML